MIIVGYPCIGKSTYANSHGYNVIDLSSENVPYRKFRLNSSLYLENDALSAKLRKLFQTFL